MSRTSVRTPVRTCASALLIGIVLATSSSGGAEQRFYPDDPIARVPETQDASGAAPIEIGRLYNLGYNLFVTPRREPSGTRAGNVNTIDEIPDSSWFTNRIGRGLPHETLLNGLIQGPPPDASSWTVLGPTSGERPGLVAADASGDTWFLFFDPVSNPEGTTAAAAIANRLFWALGYNQFETFLTTLEPSRVTISPDAMVERPSREETPFTTGDLNEILRRSARRADGAYRVVAGRVPAGVILGGFHYHGTRPDDPNDLVPHQHRRELRALRVFGAWVNLTGLVAQNTLDVVEPAPSGHRIIRHYLQDVASTFGMGVNGPHGSDEGWEYLYQRDPMLHRLMTFGFGRSPWQTLHYPAHTSVGRFEGDLFDPTTWRPHAPTRAYLEMRPDDAFWAARRVAAFGDRLIRDMVDVGELSDAAAATHLADVLIKRRDAIARAYLPAVNPLIDPVLESDGTLTFSNAAVESGVAEAASSYRAEWFRFDNATGESTRLGESTAVGPVLRAQDGWLVSAGELLRADVSFESAAHPSWREPVCLFFRRSEDGWRLVGFERLPEG